MDSISKNDKKIMKDGARKVRCPTCLKILIEPTNLRLYRCGYCSTTLQAKYYKAPVNASDSLVPSETLTSVTNTANSDSEVNSPTEKIESVFLSKPKLTDEQTVEISNVKDEASEHGGVHSDLNLENSYEIGDISKNKEGIVDQVLNDQTEKSIMMGPVDGRSSVSAIDADSPAVFGRDSPQMNLEQGGYEVDGLMPRSEVTFPSGMSLSDVNMMDITSSKDEASEPDGNPSHFNSVPCHHQRNEIESEESVIHAINFGEQVKNSLVIESTESQSKCSSTTSGSSSPAVSGRDFTLPDGTGVDSSLQKSEFVLLEEQKVSEGEMGDILSLKDNISEFNSNISHFMLVDGSPGVDDSEKKSEFVLLEGQKSSEGEMGDIVSMKDKISALNNSTSHFTLLNRGPGVDDSEQKNEIELLEEQNPSEGDMGDILSLKDTLSEHKNGTSHVTLLDGGPEGDDSERKSEFSVLLDEQKSSEKEMGDILSLKDKVSVHKSSTSHFPLLDGSPGLDDSEQKSEFVLLEEQKSLAGEMKDAFSLKDKISELNSSPTHLESEKSRDKPNTVGCQEYSVLATFLCEKVETSPIQEKNESESKCLPSVIGVSCPTVSEVNSGTSNEKSHDKPNIIGGQDDVIQATILCENVEPSRIQEKNELECKCLPSESGVSSPDVSEIMSHETNIFENGTAVDGLSSDCESVHLLDQQNIAGANTKEVHSANEELQDPTRNSHYHSEQYVHAENTEYGNQDSRKEIILLSEKVEKSLDSAELGNISSQLNKSDNCCDVDSLNGNIEVAHDVETVLLKGDFQGDEPQCQERKVNFESPTNKENTNMASDMQAITRTNHSFVILEKLRLSDVKEEHVQSSDFEIVVDALEVDKFESKQFRSVSHSISPTESRNNSSLNKSYDGYMAVDLKENIEDIHTLGTLFLKGDVCESSGSPQSPEKEYQGSGETWKSTEVKTKSTDLNMQVMSNTSHGIHDLDNARSCNIGVEREESGDNAIVEGVNTANRGHSRADDDGSLSIRAQHKQEENVSSVEAGREDPPSQLLNLSRRSVRYRNPSGSLSSINRDEVQARQVNDPLERIPERKVLQGRHGLDAMSDLALNRNEPSSRNVVHGSFQRKSSGVPEDYQSVQNWIESERAELLRSLSRFSDSTEFDRERMEILNKIDELRQLLGSSSLNRERNSMSYLEGRSHHSQSSFSESEYEYSHYSPSFSRHQHDVRSVVSKENQLVERTQSPRSRLHGLHHSPQRFPHPTPCIHSNCRACCSICSQSSSNAGLQCNFHSRIIQRNNHQFERTQKREREYDVKRYCRPILGAAHFVSCYECFHVVQIPEHFDFVASRYKQLRCGVCREILEFSVLGNTQIVPYPRETRESYEQGDRVSSSSEERTRSLGMSYSSRNHERTSHVSRNRNMPVGRRDRKQPPLHTLMGYVSARDIIFQEDN